MQKRIYIDTSIPSNYYTLRTDEISVARKQRTRQWWSEYAGQSNLVSSAITILELRRGTSQELGLYTPQLMTPLDYLGGTI